MQYAVIIGEQSYMGRVLKSLKLALFFSFLLSLFLFLLVVLFPQLLVTIFTDDQMLIRQTALGIRYYLFMLPIMGPQAVSSQYFQVVGKSKLSSFLAFFRYDIMIIPSIIILAPKIGVKGIYISNAISANGIAGLIAVIYIMAEIVRLKRMEAA